MSDTGNDLDNDDKLLNMFEADLVELATRHSSWQLSAFGTHQAEIFRSLEAVRETQSRFCLEQFSVDLTSVDPELNFGVKDGNAADGLFQKSEKFLHDRQKLVDHLAESVTALAAEV